MIDKGQWREFGQDTGVTPLLFTRNALGFLMTTESQDFGLTSHPKDGTICLSGGVQILLKNVRDTWHQMAIEEFRYVYNDFHDH